MAKINYAKNIVQKPGILQVLPALMSGSVERQVLETAKIIQEAGYRSFVASSGGVMVSELYQIGARHFELPLKSKNPFTLYRNVRKLEKLIITHDIDIIHAQSRETAWSAFLASKRTGKKFVATVHKAHAISNNFKKYYNSVMTKGSKVIAVSHFIADYLQENYKIDPSKIEVAHLCTNIDLFNYKNVSHQRVIELVNKYRLPTDKPIILMPGRFSRTKGHKYLIEAIKKITPNSVTCLIVGNDKGYEQYREELRSLIAGLELSKRVILLSNITDMPALYTLSDVVISASIKPEAFGMVAVEAQSMGRLVIATKIGGSKETIINGQTGWLVEPENSDEIASAIEEALSLQLPQRLYKAQLARDHVEKHFSFSSKKEKLLDIYSGLLYG